MQEDLGNRTIGSPTFTESEFLREFEIFNEKRLAEARNNISKDGDATQRWIQSELNRPEEEVMWGYFNNFMGHIPGGYKRRLSLEEEDEFHKDLDEVIFRLGLNMDEIKTMPRAEKTKSNLDILKRIYIEMRKLGYKHYPDLVG